MGRRERNDSPAAGHLRRDLLISVGLILITWGVFWPARQFDFVDVDDNSYVFRNPRVLQGLTWEGVGWALTARTVGNWQPVMTLSLMLDATLFGESAAGFHFTNIVIHTANALLLFWLLQRMTGAPWSSAFVAALFAVHPLHVESVAWISERKDVLYTFFGLLALLAYCRFARTGGWKWYGWALAAFFLSLASKPMLVTLPFLLLLLDYWPLRRTHWLPAGDAAENGAEAAASPPPLQPEPQGKSKGKKRAEPAAAARKTDPSEHESAARTAEPRAAGPKDHRTAAVPLGRLILEKIPFGFVTLIFCSVALATQESGGGFSPLERISFPLRLGNAVLSYGLYLWQTFWPVDLAIMYPHPEEALSWAGVAASAVFLAAVTAFVVVQRSRHPYLPVGWFWYLGTLVPVIGLVQIGRQQLADRYTYFPLIGFFIAITWFAAALASRKARTPVWLAGAALVVVAACAVLARDQVATWRNSVTLLRHALAVIDSHHPEPRGNGSRLSMVDEVRANYRYMLGWHLERTEGPQAAVPQYEQSLAIDPKLAAAHADLGAALHSLNRVNEALPHYESALALKPQDADTHANLGIALCGLGRMKEGMQSLRRALELNPSLVNAHINLGNALAVARDNDQALEHFRQAANLAPDNWLAHLKLGEALHAQGDLAGAEQALRRTIELQPDLAQAYSSLGAVLAQQGNRADAAKFLGRALQLNPRDAKARQQLEALRGP